MSPEKDFIHTQYQFCARIRDPQNKPLPNGVTSSQMKVYEQLFFNNINSFITSNFPVLHQLIAAEQWQQLIREFMRLHRCQSPLFAEIPQEFIEFLESDGFRKTTLCKQLPEFLVELATYEWLELALSFDQAKIHWPEYDEPTESVPDRSILLASPLTRLAVFQYPVQHISVQFQPDADYLQQTDSLNYLLLYRNRLHQVHFLQLNHTTALLFQLLLENNERLMPTAPLLEQLATQLKFSDLAALKQAASHILNDWLRQDIIYTRPC